LIKKKSEDGTVYRTLNQDQKGLTKMYDALLCLPAGCLHYSRRRWARQAFICCFLSLQLLIVALRALGFRICRRTLSMLHEALSFFFCFTVRCFLEGMVSKRANLSISPICHFSFISVYSVSFFFLSFFHARRSRRRVTSCHSIFPSSFLTVVIMGGLGGVKTDSAIILSC